MRSKNKKIISSAIRSIPEIAKMEAKKVLSELGTSIGGLDNHEAHRRLRTFGLNEVATEKKRTWPVHLLTNFKDPLSILLLILAVISYFTADIRSAILISTMLFLSIFLRFFQEERAGKAMEKLRAMVHITATVMRDGVKKEMPLKSLVPGDIVHLSAGDMVPGDIRVISANDLFINEAVLSGESLPVEKFAEAVKKEPATADPPNICFMGTNVASGAATAVILATGGATRFGLLAQSLSEKKEATSFERGIKGFTWLIIRFISMMAVAVFFINGFTRGDWLEAFLFALAVAVGFTPEMLPMIVTVNLSKGAIDMSRRKVVVKRLNALQNFGAIDILCTDKTGTLTQGHVSLIKHLDIEGKENEKILDYAYLNSFYQTGLKNLLDVAVLEHDSSHTGPLAPLEASKISPLTGLAERYKKIDEMPFDFLRRKMSVVVETHKKEHLLICKGAVEEILASCSRVMLGGKSVPVGALHHKRKEDIVNQMNESGFRLLAVAFRDMPANRHDFSANDEKDMTLLGFLAFFDPPKGTVHKAMSELAKLGVGVKILTGDNEVITRYICDKVNFKITRALSGAQIDTMADDVLAAAAEEANVFYKVDPSHKERIMKALKSRGHTVGFLGDGVNDAPALRAADIGISVDSAVDIAKESSDIILLEKSLTVLKDGVREGRRIFGNITKYIKMATSSNFGNSLSIIGGSIFLPFLPALPLQLIVNNFLYDVSQTAIPTDGVDAEYIAEPRKWDIGKIKKFILFFGPVTTLFDASTFLLMLFVFNSWANPALFRTGWFVESLVMQTLIIHISRTRKIPFLQSRASLTLTLMTVFIAAVAIWLPFSPLADDLGFVALPPAFWGFLLIFMALYFVLTQFLKQWFIKKYGWE